MEFKIAVLFYIVLFDSSGSSKIVIRAKINETITLDPCPIPQVENAVHSRRDWYRDNEMITSSISDELKLHESNGSLSVIASIADVNHLYGCQGLAILSNGTTVFGELQPYVISPIMPAFLEHKLQNTTVSWGEEYGINCKAGGVKSTLEIRVNGGLWPLRHIQILNDTLIECRAFNSYAEENASAYITVLPCSKEKADLNLLTDRSACQPFQITSPCSDFLEAEKPVDSVYTVSTTRLLRADSIHEILNSAFLKWDDLVPKDSPLDSVRRRCLQQAKRLVCLLAFPRCLTTEAYIDDYKTFDVDPDNQLLSAREIPVCQQHCALITTLICAGSFRQSDAVTALEKYGPTSVTKSFPQGDGWKELLGLNTNISYFLPEDGCAGLPRLITTDQSRQNDQILLGRSDICHEINFIDLVKSATSNDSTTNCYTGKGIDYRGTTAGPPSCLPWNELDYIILNSIHDPLTYLSPSLLPSEAFDPLPTNYSVCRNPLGLGAAPFCIGLNPHSSRLQMFECPALDCANVNSSAFAPNYAELSRRQRLVNMISIITTMTAFFLIISCLLFAYILRTCPREKVHISVEEARENRRAHLVARRIRFREAGCCTRCLLKCLFSFEDVCCCAEKVSKCFGRAGRENKKDLTRVDGKSAAPDLDKSTPDDEDEEVQHFREYLNHGCPPVYRVERVAATSTSVITHQQQMDNQPCLMYLDSEVGEQESDEQGQPSTLDSHHSSFKPSSRTLPERNAPSLEVFDEEQNGRVHLDSAFMLVSARQLMHPKLKRISYSRKLLMEERTLFKSAFGHVILARAPSFPLRERLGLTDSDSSVQGDNSEAPYVVVKTLSFGATPAAETSFFQEAELLIELDHPNIVKIIGICIPLQPFSLIYEYMCDGDLNTFLHRARESAISPSTSNVSGDLAVSITDDIDDEIMGEKEPDEIQKLGSLFITDLLRFALDVCEAMVYLSSRLHVHRDLATRNCLVGRGHVKLSDFSMARRLPHGTVNADFVDVDSEAPLAVRWQPLESILEGRFNLDTDVWSFGILLWEIFTLGRLPYGNVDVSGVIRALTEENRLPRPENCPKGVYSLMRSCWSSIRENRPTFRQIRTTLLSILQRFEN